MLLAAIVLLLGTAVGPETGDAATRVAAHWAEAPPVAFRPEPGRPTVPRREGFDPIAEDDSDDDDDRLTDAWCPGSSASPGRPSSPPAEHGRSHRHGSYRTSGRSPILRC